MERRLGKPTFATKPGNRLAALGPIIDLTPQNDSRSAFESRTRFAIARAPGFRHENSQASTGVKVWMVERKLLKPIYAERAVNTRPTNNKLAAERLISVKGLQFKSVRHT